VKRGLAPRTDAGTRSLPPTNLIGNGVAALVIAKWERALDERQLQRRLAGKDAEQA